MTKGPFPFHKQTHYVSFAKNESFDEVTSRPLSLPPLLELYIYLLHGVIVFACEFY